MEGDLVAWTASNQKRHMCRLSSRPPCEDPEDQDQPGTVKDRLLSVRPDRLHEGGSARNGAAQRIFVDLFDVLSDLYEAGVSLTFSRR